MAQATLYTTRFCPFCVRARQLLQRKGVDFEDIPVDGDQAARAKLLEMTGSRTVPQIWVGDNYVGGCDELMRLEHSGRLDAMLSA